MWRHRDGVVDLFVERGKLLSLYCYGLGCVGLGLRLWLMFGLWICLGVVIGLAWDFPTGSEWNFTSGAGL